MSRIRQSAAALTLVAAGVAAGSGTAGANTCMIIDTYTGENTRCLSVVPGGTDGAATGGSGYGSFGTGSLQGFVNQVVHVGSMLLSVEIPRITDSLGLTSPLSTSNSLTDGSSESLGGSIGSVDGSLN